MYIELVQNDLKKMRIDGNVKHLQKPTKILVDLTSNINDYFHFALQYVEHE